MIEFASRRDDECRLNLAQQKMRAAELCRAVTQGEPDAVARILRHHPLARELGAADVPRRLARLNDAQIVVARELGLPSWPKLKSHIESLERARAAISSRAPAPDADRPTVHVRCGSDIRESLQQAGFAGDFLEFSDPYCCGPVPRERDLLTVRSHFLAATMDIALPEVEAKLSRQYAELAQSGERYERIVLWFEHDSHDQLVLARVLAELAAFRQVPTIDLICIDRFPAITRFHGLGQLSPAALRSLWDTRSAVTAKRLRVGRAVWDALQDPSPVALHAIAAGTTPALPAMANALTRHLQELPWTGDGLSLTQRLALEQLDSGPKTVSALFKAMQWTTEPLPFLGDLTFWSILREMQRVARPPFDVDAASAPRRWPHHVLSLTATGRALLAGELDWISLSPPERWVGGIRIATGAPLWRWSAEQGRPVRRSPA